ncbi:MAG: Na+:H+ dicarboxylate symporter [Bifidobacterium tibiigranuli]|jgi:hypothetical protein|uniref:Na+:H+ dicarboxylate symporter n=1 Tax=Bifidobacterium tibiigranuli TaxID=2172043 RepID=UPI0026EDBBCE|nr:Na+:H+ dicarboxylate symporter [Bifidobacterium tibiigranuli]MCI1672899.1 Na+:H+ dicarboxylate symporter [Bifidobacterium tibiigranuli]MCI1713738.1 Na+:H+ dicarboxylate symporter [Bifidobacterium tibiigranuli]MCI1833970.1 Na+:H+ dicarboxylate symporter [Bifidobacterium tibiigranuli]
MSSRPTLGDAVAAHPIVDLFSSLILMGVWAVFGGLVPGIDNAWQDLFVALSTISGLVMTAATFICTMTYQSDSRHMKIVRERYSDELSRNWTSIIAWTMTTAVLPLASICIWNANRQIAFAVSLFALIMMTAKTVRSLHWLKYTLFMEKAAVIIGEPFTKADMEKAAARRNQGTE